MLIVKYYVACYVGHLTHSPQLGVHESKYTIDTQRLYWNGVPVTCTKPNWEIE